MKLLILTAEPKNFVPIEIEKAAIAKGVEARIVDVKKVVVEEAGKLFLLGGDEENPKLEELMITSDTVVIPRLNEYHLDTKIAMLQKMVYAGAKLVNSPEGMSLCNDKLLSQVKLNQAGIRTPKSWVIQDADAFDVAIKLMEDAKMFEFPIIVKTFRGTHGIGVMKLDSRSSLVSVGQTLLKEGIDFMLQEFCKHDQSVRIIMKGTELLASNLRGQPKEKDEFRTNSHLGSETTPNVPSETELAMARKIVELFGTNFCAIDYILLDSVKEGYSKGDGIPIDAPEGHVHWQTNVVSEGVKHPDRLLKRTKVGYAWSILEVLKEDAQPEGFDKDIMVLEVNGSPGLEAIQKNWPSKNLAAEVVDYALSLVTQDQAGDAAPGDAPVLPTPGAEAPSNDTVAATELSPEEEPKQEDTLKLIEPVLLHVVMKGETEAKVDTGATTSSLHVDSFKVDGEMVRFTRGESTYSVPLLYMRHVKNNAGGDSAERPVVALDITIKGRRYNRVAFSLNNREHMKYEALVGRNLIELIGLPVEVEHNPGAADASMSIPASSVSEE